MISGFDPSFDELDDKLDLCRSCNAPLIHHLGLYGTCAELVAARKRCEELAAAVLARDATIRELQMSMGEGQ